MLRRISLVIFPMLILTTLLLTYQWSMYVYGDQTTTTSPQEPIVHIQLEHTDDQISVTQTIKNLHEGTYPLLIPSNANKVQCEIEEGKPCLIQKQHVTVSENQQLRWQYQLNYDKDTAVYTDWFIKLQKNNQSLQGQLNIEVIEKNEPFWQWVAPAKLQADIQKDYIRYYRWSSNQIQSFPLLHMTDNSYNVHQEEGLYVFAKGTDGEKYKELLREWKNSPYEGPNIVIVNQSHEETTGESHMIIPEIDIDAIKQNWLSQSLRSKYDGENSWLMKLLTHYFYDKPSQDSKTTKMVNALSYQLSSSQKQLLLQEVLKAESSQLASELDQDLQRVVGKPTAFFDLNQKHKDPFVPLYFMENKDLKVNGEKADITWKPIIYKQERYYPLAGIAPLFGFELVAIPAESLYIMRKDGESWRFSLNKKTFVHNEEDFGVVSDVLINIRSEVFIKEKYVEELLGISVNEGSYSINMLP